LIIKNYQFKKETEKSKFFGKIPLYQYHIDPLNLEQIGFHELIYIQKFLNKNNITSNNLIKEIKTNFMNETLSHFSKLISFTSANIELYLSLLNYYNDISYSDETNF
jgi:hypothetical protein